MSTLASVSTPALKVRSGPHGGNLYEVRRALRLGRHPYNEVSLNDPHTSRYHCWVTTNDSGFVIEDLASTNGTFVNGVRIRTRQILKPGDVIRVGITEFVFTEQE